jgi:hypothetical protein
LFFLTLKNTKQKMAKATNPKPAETTQASSPAATTEPTPVVIVDPAAVPLTEDQQSEADQKESERMAKFIESSNTTKAPVLDEPNLPKDEEVIRNRAGGVVTTDTGMGIDEAEEKEPSATVQKSE